MLVHDFPRVKNFKEKFCERFHNIYLHTNNISVFPPRYVYVSKEFISLSNGTCILQLAILYMLPKPIILNTFKWYSTLILTLELNVN